MIFETQEYMVIPLTYVTFGPGDSIQNKNLKLSMCYVAPLTSILSTNSRSTDFCSKLIPIQNTKSKIKYSQIMPLGL